MISKVITSKSNKEFKDLLKIKKEAKDYFIVEGIDLVTIAKESHELLYTISADKKVFDDIDHYQMNEQLIDALSNYKSPQKVLGLVRLDKLEITGNKLVYLDNVQDPGNVGTIIRTCLSLGYDGLILSKDSCNFKSFKVIQASKGAIFKLPIVQDNILFSLKEKGYQIVSTALRDSIDLEEVKVADKYIVVFGNEGRGVKEEILNNSDVVTKIKIYGIDSLNVAIACGIVLYTLNKE